MKKFFTFFLALVAVMAVNAKQVVFDFTNPEALGIKAPAASAGTVINDSTIVVDGVTMTNEKKASTDTRIWNKSGVYDLRIYTNSTITFAAEENITAVAFDGANIKFSEVTGKAWIGDPALSVTFTASGTCNINTVTVYIGETPEIWTPDTVNVAQARALIDAKDANDHYVKGIVACQPFNTFSDFSDGRVSFYMLDDLASTDSLQAYQVLDKKNAKWASLEAAWEELRIGDTVLVYASSLKLYAAKNIYEIDPGYYVEKLGANPNPPEIVYPTVDTITTVQAVEIAQALKEPDAGKSTTTADEYVVGGYAVKVWDRNSDKTWSFGMCDEEGGYYEFQASNATIKEGADTVVTNEYMYVRGRIAKRKTNSGNIQLQIYKGDATHGEAPAPVVLEPITVAKAIEIAIALNPEKTETATTPEKYAVKGYVVSVSEKYEKTYYLADEAGAYGEFQAFKCASVDREVAQGDLVIVTGKISNYYGEGSSGEYHNYEIKGGTLVHAGEQGIENVQLTEKAQKIMIDGAMYILRNGKMYDVRGAQVR